MAGPKDPIKRVEWKKYLSIINKGRIPPNKGIKTGPLSEEVKKNISKATRGKSKPPFTEDHKKKLRESNIGKHSHQPRSEEVKQKLRKPRKYPMTEIHKIHIKESYKKFYESLSEEDKQKRRMKRALIVIPFKDTKPEKMLQIELTKRGYIYVKHYPIEGQPDIAFPEKKIAIFADGDYYHGNPDKYISTDKIHYITVEERWNMDKKVNEYLYSQGWLVLRYWQSEILASVENVVDEIEDVLSR
jgi:DNA mismatch endonuclease (patch repair protein)